MGNEILVEFLDDGSTGSKASRLGWIDLLRTSAGIGLFALTLAIGDLFVPETLEEAWDGYVVIGLLAVAYLGICSARAMKLWQVFEGRNREGTSRRDAPNPFGELFVYLLLALIVLVLSIADGTVVWPWLFPFESFLHIGLYVGLVFLAFVPLAFAIRKHNRYVHKDQGVPHHFSNESLLFASALILLVGGLAWAAGEGKIQMAGNFGPVIMSIVLFLFLTFIAVPYVHSYLLGRSDTNKKMDYENVALNGVSISDPSTIVSWLDTFLVRHVAPLTGATQVSKFVALPHLLLISIFLPLTFMGFSLPAPFGLVPIFFALLLAVSLGRRWAWVESDRETAMRLRSTKDKHIQIGFRNDLRDEALLGYLFLFILIPLALRQMQLWLGAFGDSATEASLMDWAAFFGTELAKAVPIVDWADIYGIQADLQNFNTQGRFSQHLIFGARLMVDLVVIAALLQAFSIMQRNSSQMQLFRDGQLDLLDPFTEQAHIDRGVRLSSRNADGVLAKDQVAFDGAVYRISENLLAMFEDHAENCKGPAVPYNLERLGELLADDQWIKGQVLVEFLKKKFEIQVGSASRRLQELAQSWQGKDYFAIKVREFDGERGEKLRHQRILLESISNKLLAGTTSLDDPTLLAVASILESVSRRSEMFNAKAALFELLARQPSKLAVAILASAIIDKNKMDLADLNSFEVFSHLAEYSIRQSVDDVRVLAVEALEEAVLSENVYGHIPGEQGRLALARIVLEGITREGVDTKEPRTVARNALKRIAEEAAP